MKIILGIVVVVVAFFVSFAWSPGMYVAKHQAKIDSDGLAKNIKLLNSTKLPDGTYKMTIYYTYNNKECISKGRAKLEGFTSWHTSGFMISCEKIAR